MSGCDELSKLGELKPYNTRYRLCKTHMKAESVMVNGILQRFCQIRATRASNQHTCSLSDLPCAPAAWSALLFSNVQWTMAAPPDCSSLLAFPTILQHKCSRFQPVGEFDVRLPPVCSHFALGPSGAHERRLRKQTRAI